MQRSTTRAVAWRDVERGMDDKMNRQEFAEYMTAFERRLDGRFGRIDRRLDGIDGRLDGMDGRLDSIDGQLDGHDKRFDAMDQRLDDLKQSMTVQFEDTRREIKLSLEAVEAVGERMDRRFDDMRSEHASTTAPLADAVRHVARQATSPLRASKRQKRRS